MTSIFNSLQKQFQSIAAYQKKEAKSPQGQFRLRKSITLGETFLLHIYVQNADDEGDLANITSSKSLDIFRKQIQNKYKLPWDTILQIIGLFSENYLKDADSIRPLMREIKIVSEVTSFPEEKSQDWECVLQKLNQSFEIGTLNRSEIDSTVNSVTQINLLPNLYQHVNTAVTKLDNPQGQLQDFLQIKGWKMYDTHERRTENDQAECEISFTIELAGKIRHISQRFQASNKKEAKTGAVRKALAFMYLNYPETWRFREERYLEKQKQTREMKTRAYFEGIKSYKSELNMYIQREPKVFMMKPMETISSGDAHMPMWRVTVELEVTIPKHKVVVIEKTSLDKSKKEAEQQAVKQIVKQIWFRFRELIVQKAILSYIKFDQTPKNT